MIRALLDTNVILDFMLARPPFVDATAQVIEAHRAGRFQAFISPITPVNVFYVTRKLGAEQGRQIQPTSAEALTTLGAESPSAPG